jgi:hypothetical protein
MEQQKLPYEISETQARTGYYNRMPNAQGGRGADYTPSPSEIKTAQDLARNLVTTAILSGESSVGLMSKEFNELVQQKTQEILQTSGKFYTPMQVDPSSGVLQKGPDGSVNYVPPK